MKLSRIPAGFLMALLRAYKRVLSPLFLPACRYAPTCSEYALEAVDRHGAMRGAGLALWRLLRCHPLAQGGYDPVPTDLPRLDFMSAEPRSAGRAGVPVPTRPENA